MTTMPQHDWRIELMRAHPRLFEVMVDKPEFPLGYSDIRDGWRDVVERLCIRIEKALQAGETFRFIGVVRKFGILRIDWAGEVSEETRARIEEALALGEARSSCTCELCGAEGEKYHSGRVVLVRCETHAEGKPLTAASSNGRLHIVRMADPPHPRVRTLRRYDRDADTFVGPPIDELPDELAEALLKAEPLDDHPTDEDR